MICTHCNNDVKHKERPNRVCSMCHHRFAFEPREGDIMTDVAFRNAIDAVSAGGRLRWGVEHLYYEVCRRRRGFIPGVGTLFLIAAVFFIILLLFGWWPGTGLGLFVFVAGTALAVFVWYRMAHSLIVRVTLEKFNKMWKRWQEVHGTPEGVIIRRKREKRDQTVEPDLGDYSFDRAVICDRGRTVDLLLANNFHFENNCAVLSIGGYPEGPFETVRTMLKRNPRLQVYALHDVRPLGCRMAHRLTSDPAWFKNGGEVKDIGLRPHHTKKFARLYLPSETPHMPPGEGVSEKEAKWLALYGMELAALRPEQIIKAVFKALNDTEEHPDSFG